MRGIVLLIVAAMLGGYPRLSERDRAAAHAAPSVIVFSGGPLKHPIVLSDWAENVRLMSALTVATTHVDSSLRHRHRIQVAMYWDGDWSRFASSPDSLALLNRIRTPQPGAYYPREGNAPGVWIFGAQETMPGAQRGVGAEAESILRKYGVPVAVR